MYLVKWDNFGNQIWNKSWGENNDDFGEDVALDSEGYIYVTGTKDDHNDGKIALIKYNSSGYKIWENTSNTIYDDRGKKLAIDHQNNIYIAGYMDDGDHNLIILKYNSSGDKIWEEQWGGTVLKALMV